MEGRFVFKHAVTRMPEVLRETLDAAGVKLDDVDLFLFHQANLRINEFVAQSLGIPPEKCPSNIERFGNCSAASIPMLLDEAVRSGRLAPGQLVAMTAFGSGLHLGHRRRPLVARRRQRPMPQPRALAGRRIQFR